VGETNFLGTSQLGEGREVALFSSCHLSSSRGGGGESANEKAFNFILWSGGGAPEETTARKEGERGQTGMPLGPL